jgi:hypothetical protein
MTNIDDPVYGISYNQDMKSYIIVFKYKLYCEKCDEELNIENIESEWCRKCQLNDLKLNFANWTSKNNKIDNLIQKMQLKIKSKFEEVFEWLPYNQFNNIKKVNNGNFTKILYSAIWKNDFLYYDNLYEKKQIRRLKSKVTLKYLQNNTYEVIFINLI